MGNHASTKAPVKSAPQTVLSKTKRPRKFAIHITPKLIGGLVIIGVIVVTGLIFPFFLGDPWKVSDVGLTGPSAQHWLGTTASGQDIFTQLFNATRGSLFIGVVVGVAAVSLSAVFGIVGAYIGGIADDTFTLITNVMLVIPGLPLVMIISSYIPYKSAWMVALVLAITSWAGAARVLRSQTLSVRSRDYVLAARVAGEKTWRVLFIEILPNLIPVIASQALSAVIAGILGEAGLSYLGLGATDSMTWGTMLYYAQNGLALKMGAWWWFAPPGLCIALFGAALAMINSSIDEIINPKLKAATKKQIKQWQAEERAAKIAFDQQFASKEAVA